VFFAIAGISVCGFSSDCNSVGTNSRRLRLRPLRGESGVFVNTYTRFLIPSHQVRPRLYILTSQCSTIIPFDSGCVNREGVRAHTIQQSTVLRELQVVLLPGPAPRLMVENLLENQVLCHLVLDSWNSLMPYLAHLAKIYDLIGA